MSSEDLEPIVNQSNNPSFFDVLEQRLSRRQWLSTVAAGAAIQMMPMAFVEAATPSAGPAEGLRLGKTAETSADESAADARCV